MSPSLALRAHGLQHRFRRTFTEPPTEPEAQARTRRALACASGSMDANITCDVFSPSHLCPILFVCIASSGRAAPTHGTSSCGCATAAPPCAACASFTGGARVGRASAIGASRRWWSVRRRDCRYSSRSQAYASRMVPVTMSRPASQCCQRSVSPRNSTASAMATTTLSLSTGATRDASPSLSARK